MLNIMCFVFFSHGKHFALMCMHTLARQHGVSVMEQEKTAIPSLSGHLASQHGKCVYEPIL